MRWGEPHLHHFLVVHRGLSNIPRKLGKLADIEMANVPFLNSKQVSRGFFSQNEPCKIENNKFKKLQHDKVVKIGSFISKPLINIQKLDLLFAVQSQSMHEKLRSSSQVTFVSLHIFGQLSKDEKDVKFKNIPCSTSQTFCCQYLLNFFLAPPITKHRIGTAASFISHSAQNIRVCYDCSTEFDSVVKVSVNLGKL